MITSKRLRKELLKIQQEEALPPGITLDKADNLESWTMDMRVVDESNQLYRGQRYRLKFTFPSNYPIEAPEVVFVAVPAAGIDIPLHPHIYSNGIICLDLLDKQGWSPVHSVESVCVSVQSMLTGNTLAERPPEDAEFVKGFPRRPRDINFAFHDDSV